MKKGQLQQQLIETAPEFWPGAPVWNRTPFQ
jgi:hypothetical protein